MKIWTYEEARDKVKLDLDLLEEEFIAENEFIGYFNEGIDEAESEIHKIHEDYFLTKATISLVTGTQDYALPSDIYGCKIRSLIYANGTDIYPIRRVRNERPFEDIRLTELYGASEDYRYLIRNDASTGFRIQLVPTSRHTGAYVTCWYLRNANRIPLVGEAKPVAGNYILSEVEAIEIDIPEFITFVMQFVKCRCMEKEGDPRLPEAFMYLEKLRKQMVDTLTQMIVDNDDEVIRDMTYYQEHN